MSNQTARGEKRNCQNEDCAASFARSQARVLPFIVDGASAGESSEIDAKGGADTANTEISPNGGALLDEEGNDPLANAVALASADVGVA